jgi:murein L,D-transpeptidase YcbB/YkuD
MAHGKNILTSRVMVGKVDSRTPTFSGFIYSIVLNPTWIVPASLYKKFQPLVGKDGFYMKNGQLFQSAGPKNHLGQIKFLTQRSDAIILHSTHEPELFASAMRAYSFGCVRVQSFAPLAQQILSIENISMNIDTFLEHKKMKKIHLPKPFPIYVVYHTIWVDRGIIHVFPDIYGKNTVGRTHTP